MRVGLWLAAFVVAMPAAAQGGSGARPGGAQATGPTGTVVGTVLAQDTQRPIRFAQVTLQNVESVANAAGGGTNRGFLGAGGGFGGGAGARSEADGTFTATGVAPGDYYVTATALGYIPLRSQLLTAVNNGSDPGQLLAGLPVVHVEADGTSSVSLSLQRGGALAGRVSWEDGSAAAAVSVTAVPVAAQGVTAVTQLPMPLAALQLGGFGQLTQTDDRGDFRISGLPSGEYQLQAVIQTGGRAGGGFGGRGVQVPSVIRVYAPGVFRRGGAKSYSVRAGDERTDVRLSIDLRGLRTVSGHASSTAAGTDVKSGRVSLVDSSDSSLQLQGAVDAEGNFTVRYVPPGNYTLQVSGASSQANQFGRRGGEAEGTTAAVTFQPASQAAVVTDMDVSGVGVSLTPVQSQQ